MTRAGQAARLCGVVLALAAVAAGAAEPKPSASPPPSRELVRRGTVVMKNLETGNFAAILDEMQHPPDSTKQENAGDRRMISVALQFLASRFGKLESYEVSAEAVECFWVKIGMGSLEYWEKLPASQRGGGIAFASRHAKVQSAMIRITESFGDGPGWIRTLEFGIPAKIPGAKGQIEQMAREMVSRMDSATRMPKSAPAPAPH